MTTTRDRTAIRRHPRKRKPILLAAGLVLQELFWLVSRVVDRGRYSPKHFDVNEFDLPLERLPAAFDGYRIIHLSDIHMGTWMNRERLEGVVELVLEEKPDLVAITGDFVSYTLDVSLDELAEVLARLHAPDGVYAVRGNHDCWTDPDRVSAMLGEAGIVELRNDFIRIERAGQRLYLAGVDDVYDGRADLEAVITRLPEDGAAILLAHEPDFADEAAGTGRFDLQLSGHSHGGQLNFPVVGPLYLPQLAKKYVRGLYRVGAMHLYVNRGLGTTALQLRVRCRPEIAVIALRSGLTRRPGQDGTAAGGMADRPDGWESSYSASFGDCAFPRPDEKTQSRTL
ncbi:MAG TPA: metallophosphoesterase [Anaerolineales bacterium]|nr:metallophosphoesterase [Anaerolineales bacterium]